MTNETGFGPHCESPHSEFRQSESRQSESDPGFMDPGFIQDLARRLAADLPDGVRAMRADLQRNFETLLQNALGRLDLVTREEFEIQRRVLERTREKLAKLEAGLAGLEAREPSPDLPPRGTRPDA